MVVTVLSHATPLLRRTPAATDGAGQTGTNCSLVRTDHRGWNENLCPHPPIIWPASLDVSTLTPSVYFAFALASALSAVAVACAANFRFPFLKFSSAVFVSNAMISVNARPPEGNAERRPSHVAVTELRAALEHLTRVAHAAHTDRALSDGWEYRVSVRLIHESLGDPDPVPARRTWSGFADAT